jgi:hypothetical protein
MFRSEQEVIPGSEPQNYDDILRKQKVFSQSMAMLPGELMEVQLVWHGFLRTIAGGTAMAKLPGELK